jgi:hypothetical protein
MNRFSALEFHPTPASLALSIVLATSVAILSYVSWRRRGSGWGTGLLEALRLTIVGLGCLLLNQPEWVDRFEPTERPTIAVLWDDSPSMQTCDVVEPGSGVAPRTRRDAAAPLASESAWTSLAERFEIALLPVGGGGSTAETNLHQPLVDALDKFDRLAGIVLASDGDWNAGPPPAEAAASLRLASVPVLAVPLGSPQRLPDVELLSLDAPTFGVKGKSVRIPFSIDSSLPRGQTVTVSLRGSDGSETTQEVKVAPQGRTHDAIVWTPADEGDFTLELTVPPVPGETLADNNRLSAPIAIRAERLRVLVVESYPRWEYRYLRNALSRDPGVEVSCLLFHPGLDKRGGGNQDYIKEFPAGLDELSTYDVVFLGDVGVEEGQLTEEHCRLLRGLVEQQASGLVFMPGWQGRQLSLIDTELRDLMPVLLDAAQPGGWGSRVPNQFELTESGRRSLLTRLADGEWDNADVWDALPGFQWYAPVVRAKAGAEVLCVHREASNEYGRLPLLVTQTYGAGKTLFMGTDGAWRWRKGVEDKYHYRFWGQVVRWMAYQRHMAQGESMRLYYTPDQPTVGRSLALSANVMEPSGEPLSRGEVAARITAPSGRTETVRFEPTNAEWGAFAAQYVAREPGKHGLTLSCRETGAVLETSFFVQGSAAEPVGRPARPEVLEEIARITRGSVLRNPAPEEILEQLAALPQPEPIERRVQLWCHPAALATMICLLGTFWIGRKMQGVI